MAVPRLKKNDNNLYPGPEGAQREREFTNETNPKDIFTEYCIQLADIDEEIAKLLDTGSLGLTVEGNPVPVIQVDNERWGEFAKTWQLQNGDNNISPPLITVRRTDEQVGTLLGQKWTIPNRKHFTTLKVPTFENGIRGVRLFQMTQPTSIDAIYEIRLIALYKEDTTAMAENFLREYNGRQLYINVKGKYFPTLLEEMSKEDTMEEIDADRYYVRIFNVKVQCSIQRLEDFREIDLPNRIITLTELQGEVIAQTSQTIIAPSPEPPSLGVNVSGAELFGGASGYSGRNNGGIVDIHFNNVTKMLIITTISGDYNVDLSTLMDDVTVQDAQFNPVTKVLSIRSTDGNIVEVAIPAEPAIRVTALTFNNGSKELSIRSSDGNAVSTSLASLVPVPEAITHANMLILKATGGLTPGKQYLVIARPATTIGLIGDVLVRAANTSNLESDAVLVSNVPNYAIVPRWYQMAAAVGSFTKAYSTYQRILPEGAPTFPANATGDDALITHSLPFSFFFAGRVHTTIGIDTNGRIMLGDKNTSIAAGDTPEYYNRYESAYTRIYNATTPLLEVPPILGMNWNDNQVNIANGIFYFTKGVAPNRVFVVDFDQVFRYGGTTLAGGQVALYESTGQFSLTYTGDGSVGGTQGIFYTTTSGVVRDLETTRVVNQTIRYTPLVAVTPDFPFSEVIWNGTTWTKAGSGTAQPGTSAEWVVTTGVGRDRFGNPIPAIFGAKYYASSDIIAERRDTFGNTVRGEGIRYFPWGNSGFTNNVVNTLNPATSLLNRVAGLTKGVSLAVDAIVRESNTVVVAGTGATENTVFSAKSIESVNITANTITVKTGEVLTFRMLNSSPIITASATSGANRVGINNQSPSHTLSVSGEIGFTNVGGDTYNRLNSTTPGVLQWDTTTNQAEFGFAVSSFGTRKVYLNASGNTFFMGGNVGVGVQAPTAKFQVAGVIHSTSGGFRYADNTVQTTAGHTGPIVAGFTTATKILTIVPNLGGATNVDLSSLNPYPGATTLDYFQGFTADDVLNITNNGNWNTNNNGEYTGPALTTYHRAVHEVFASATVPGTLYSTNGLGQVNRYFSN